MKRCLAWFILHPSAFILPLFVAWSAAHLDGFSWDYDEGTHTYEAWLVQQGHPLYAQTFSAYTPGFIMALVGAYNLFGATMFTARMVAVACSALGIVGVMICAGELVRTPIPQPLPSFGKTRTGEGESPSPVKRRRDEVGILLAELAAAITLWLTPFFLQWSRAAMSDVPAAAVTALAVALVLVYVRDRRLRWLFAAEVVLAAALWIKAVAVGGAAAVALGILIGLRARRADSGRALIGSLVIVVLAALPLLFFDVCGLYEQAIYFHAQKRAAYDPSLVGNFQVLLDYLSNNITLTSLALLGAVMSLRHCVARPAALVTLAWFAVTFAALLWQTPIFANHHPVVLVFPLAALAGVGLSFAICDLEVGSFKRALSPRLLVALSVLFIAVLNLNQLPDQLRAALAPPLQPPAEEAVTLLRALTSPSDLLVSDAQVIAFRAQRQSPPALSDMATARLASSNLTAQQLIALTQQSDANTVLFWSGRLESATPFVEWVERNYHLVRSSFQKPSSPYRFFVRAPHPQVPLTAKIGDGITLFGYDLNRRDDAPIVAGQLLSLTLYFQRTGAIDQSYTIFAHLLNATGMVVAQEDRLPLVGRYPTDQWRADEFIADEFVLPLDDDLSAGNYRIEVGMYLRETVRRLLIAVAGARQPDDRLLLPPIVIHGRTP